MSIGNVMGANNPLSVTEARKTNDTSSLDSKIEQLKKQIEQIKKNKEISQEEKDKRIVNIENQIVKLEQQKSNNTSSVEMRKRFDTYEAQPEQQTPGLYQVTRDEEGRQIIQIDKSWETAQEENNAEPQNESEKPIIVKTTGNTDKVDREIEKLKQTQGRSSPP